MRPLSTITIAALLSVATPALAGALDGEWKRDDGKLYLIANDYGIQENPGEYGCRLQVGVVNECIAIDLCFTRIADETGLLRTHASPVEDLGPGQVTDTLRLDFEWIELDAQGKVSE